jgi:uncharacterized protein
MNKSYYVLYLIPRRPDFAQTMTPEERTIMMQHIGYWTNLMNQGMVLVFGPVMDPKETYGIGIVVVDNEAQLLEFMNNDPAASINKYEYYPMRAVVPTTK